LFALNATPRRFPYGRQRFFVETGMHTIIYPIKGTLSFSNFPLPTITANVFRGCALGKTLDAQEIAFTSLILCAIIISFDMEYRGL
jgi:hypothetical protein